MVFRSLTTASAVLLLCGCAEYTTARYATDYAATLSRNPMFIAPPSAEANTVEIGGAKTRAYNYEDHIEPILAKQAEEQLSAKGYRAKVISKKEMVSSKGYPEYEAFKSAFNSVYKDAFKNGRIIKRDQAKNSVLLLNGSGKALGHKLNAPVFVYIDYNESVRSSGGEALDFAKDVAFGVLTAGAAGVTAAEKAVAVVALIDTEQDKVLWVDSGGDAGGGWVDGVLHTDEERAVTHIRNSVAWALMTLPDRDKLTATDR